MGPYSVVHSHWDSGHWVDPTNETDGWTGTMRYVEGYESISDSVTPSKQTKPVTHERASIKRSTIDSYDEYTFQSNRYQVNGPGAHWHSWGVYGKVSPSNMGVVFQKDIPTLLREAKHKFASTNETDNLLNLVESSQLIDGTGGFIEWVLPRKGKKPKLGKDLLGASNQYLYWSFGVAPLISDMKKIDAGIRKFKRDMDNYIRNYRKPFTITASCSGSLSIANTTGMSGYSPISTASDGSWWHVGILPMGPVKRTVGIRGRRNVDYNSDAWKKLDYVISRYVATGPASFAWEKIPWSFVVDWFVDLTSIVDALDNAFTGFNKSIEDCWLSEKWEVLVPVYKHQEGGWFSSQDGQQTALNEISYYHREYLNPSITLGLRDRFGKKQASYLAALLHQQVAKLIRK
jgi:hypothetical protein